MKFQKILGLLKVFSTQLMAKTKSTYAQCREKKFILFEKYKKSRDKLTQIKEGSKQNYQVARLKIVVARVTQVSMLIIYE